MILRREQKYRSSGRRAVRVQYVNQKASGSGTNMQHPSEKKVPAIESYVFIKNFSPSLQYARDVLREKRRGPNGMERDGMGGFRLICTT